MSVKDFDKKFGLTGTIEEEKERFVNRVEASIFEALQKYDAVSYNRLYNKVCYELGLNARQLKENQHFLTRSLPTFRSLTAGDFLKTLRTLVAIYTSLSDTPQTQSGISKLISKILSMSSVNIGVSWSNGVFFPTGEELLDKELIENSLQSLVNYPNEQKDMKNALQNYYTQSLYGVVENCYRAVEGLGRKLLGNNNTLIDNKPALIELLQFSQYWKKIFANYLGYANEYHRHAGENRHNLKPSEVESFLYLTCLIIRATVRAYNERV
jgi:hypothetical protein